MIRNQSMESENSSQFNEKTKAKAQALIDAFGAMDKNLDNQLSKEEIVSFLDKHSNGRKFDPNLINKMMKEMDIDTNGFISVEEFIKGYIDYEMNINKIVQDLKIGYEDSQRQYNDLNAKCQRSRLEEQSNDGMSKNAKITMIIKGINFENNSNNYQKLAIEVKYKYDSKQTDFYSFGTHITVNHQFEFFPTSRKDDLEIILKGIDDRNKEFNIGTKVFSLTDIKSQDEYDIDISISEITNVNKTIATIDANITFFWSDYLVFDAQRIKAEKRLDKARDNISKSNAYIAIMNAPINVFLKKDDQYVPSNNSDPYRTNKNFVGTDSDTQKNKDDSLQNRNPYINQNATPYQIREEPHNESHYSQQSSIMKMVEGVIMKTFKQERVQWKCITKVITFIVFVIGLINCIYRPDFPTPFLCLILYGLIISSEIEARAIRSYIQWIIYAIIGLILLDTFWLLFVCTDKSGEVRYDHFIRVISFWFTIVNIVFKGILAGTLFIQKGSIK